MKRVVLTHGLIAGGILAAMMFATIPFMDRIGYDYGQIIGYTTMVLAFLFIFIGVRRYRDHVGGAIGFGRAFRVGASIALVASACYVAAWQVMQRTVAQDFAGNYAARMLETARADGATEAELEAQRAEYDRFQQLYRNPFFNIGITFLEVLPVGLVVAAVSAGILRRRPLAQ